LKAVFVLQKYTARGTCVFPFSKIKWEEGTSFLSVSDLFLVHKKEIAPEKEKNHYLKNGKLRGYICHILANDF